MIKQSSSSPVTINANTATNQPTTSSWSVSDQLVNSGNPSSCVTATTTTTAATSTSKQIKLCQKMSSCIITNANTANNRRPTIVQSLEEQMDLSRNLAARISSHSRRANRCMKALEQINISQRLPVSCALSNANTTTNQCVTTIPNLPDRRVNYRNPSSRVTTNTTTDTSTTDTITTTSIVTSITSNTTDQSSDNRIGRSGDSLQNDLY